jgi:hypothetical protein
MAYWLDLFTGTTWKEFQKAGSKISGFRMNQKVRCNHVKPGDRFLCYLTGVMRWVGALEVVKGPFEDNSPIWADAAFPVRFEVRSLVELEPEHGVPMEQLQGRVDFFSKATDKGKFKGFLRGSPNRFKRGEDAELIVGLLREAQRKPTVRPVDPKKLARKPLFKAERRRGKTTVSTVVSVPEPDESREGPQPPAVPADESAKTASQHTHVQYELLKLGSDMGLDVWVARNDRQKMWNGEALGKMPRMVSELPTQFNEATNRTIELIDVLWLKGNSIVAAFEVECTTAVYSGLLRMSDLLALQPNLDIKLYLVAPDERRNKVEQEILRPTFKLRDRPVPEVCGFLPFTTLKEKVDGIQKLGIASSLKPDFLDQTAEFFRQEELEG